MWSSQVFLYLTLVRVTALNYFVFSFFFKSQRTDTSTSQLTGQRSSRWDRGTELLGLNPVSLSSGNSTQTSPRTPRWENWPEPRASHRPALQREPPTGTTDARISATTGPRGAWRPERGGGSTWKARHPLERWVPSPRCLMLRLQRIQNLRLWLNPMQDENSDQANDV